MHVTSLPEGMCVPRRLWCGLVWLPEMHDCSGRLQGGVPEGFLDTHAVFYFKRTYFVCLWLCHLRGLWAGVMVAGYGRVDALGDSCCFEGGSVIVDSVPYMCG